MTDTDVCAHPADALSTLKSGTIRCTACGTDVPPPQSTVCSDNPNPYNVAAADRFIKAAEANGWTVEVPDVSKDRMTVRVVRGDERGYATWETNQDGAWRFGGALIGDKGVGARQLAARLVRAPVPAPAPEPAATWVPAQPHQTPGQLVPGEGDVATEPTANPPRPECAHGCTQDCRGIGCGEAPKLATVTPIRPDVLPVQPFPLGPGGGLSAIEAAQLAPAPPVTAPTMPTGTLASFMAAAPAKPTTTRGNSDWANRYADTLEEIIHWHGKHSDRNLQVHLGPSELGVTCDRQVAGKFAGIPATNNVVDPWPSILGTAGHAWLDKAFRAENARYGLRWIPENKVVPHPDHSGTADLYDGAEQAVVDWKILAADKIESIAAKGPSVQYQIQLLLYGRGYINLGLPVRRVVLAALPRTRGSLKSMYVWEHVLTPDDDRVIEEVFKLTAIRKAWAEEIIAGRIGLLNVPATPDSDTCYFCPFYRPEAATNPTAPGCPGTAR